MRVVLQRVTQASVSVAGETVGAIGQGVLLLTGITQSDSPAVVEKMARKIAMLRIFPALDGPSGFDRALPDIGGAALVVSQFTLYGDTSGGRRPSFIQAARPEIAEPLVEYFAAQLRVQGLVVAQGVFGADMQVSLVNDGPVTLVLDV
jgi:D-tyrosyl-tRNA(Tyr) deacylase